MRVPCICTSPLYLVICTLYFLRFFIYKRVVADDIGWTKTLVSCVGTAAFFFYGALSSTSFSNARRMEHFALPLVDYIRSEGGKRESFFNEEWRMKKWRMKSLNEECRMKNENYTFHERCKIHSSFFIFHSSFPPFVFNIFYMGLFHCFFVFYVSDRLFSYSAEQWP